MEGRRGKVIILALVVIAVVVFVLTRSLGADDGEEREEGPVGGPQAVDTAGPGEGTDDGEADEWEPEEIEAIDLPDGDEEAVMSAAAAFVETWQSWSYEDEQPKQWADRAADLSTGEFAEDLRKVADTGDADSLNWKVAVQRGHEQTTTAERITPFFMDEDQNEVRVDVLMDSSRTSSSGDFTGQWEQTAQITLVRDGDGWLVSYANAYVAHPNHDHGDEGESEG